MSSVVIVVDALRVNDWWKNPLCQANMYFRIYNLYGEWRPKSPCSSAKSVQNLRHLYIETLGSIESINENLMFDKCDHYDK